MNLDLKLRNARIKLRDIKNRITGKDKVIEEYRETMQKIANMSDHENDPQVKKKLQELCQRVTDEKWNISEGCATVEDYDPYKGSKKTTRAKIKLAQEGLKQIAEYGSR